MAEYREPSVLEKVRTEIHLQPKGVYKDVLLSGIEYEIFELYFKSVSTERSAYVWGEKVKYMGCWVKRRGKKWWQFWKKL